MVNATVDRSRLGRGCYCILMPLSLMANDLSFLEKIKNDLLGNSLSWLRQRKMKTQYLLAQFYSLKSSKRVYFCNGT